MMADCKHCKQPIGTEKKNRGRPYIYCSNPCRIAGERANRVAWSFGRGVLSHHKVPYRRLPGD